MQKLSQQEISVPGSYVIVANGGFLPEDQLHRVVAGKHIVALDGAIDVLLEYGIVPHVLLGDFDSIKQPYDAYGVLVVPKPSQSYTDLQKGIYYCDQKGAKSIEVVCATSDTRMDHCLGNIRLLRGYNKHDRKLCIYTAKEKIQYLKDSSCVISGKPGDICAILGMPLGTFTSKGLKWEGNATQVEMGVSDNLCNELVVECAEIHINGEALVIGPFNI